MYLEVAEMFGVANTEKNINGNKKIKKGYSKKS